MKLEETMVTVVHDQSGIYPTGFDLLPSIGRPRRDSRRGRSVLLARNVTCDGLPFLSPTAWHRCVLEAEKVVRGEPDSLNEANATFDKAVSRLRDAGVSPSVDAFTFSPHCGPDVADEVMIP